jgi:hypothetical protein
VAVGAQAKAFVRLAGWLGPWTHQARTPERVRSVVVDGMWSGRPVKVRRYNPPGRPHGVVILALGLHYQGPDDPRADRFARVLADSGVIVWAPYVPTFQGLRLDPDAIAEFRDAVAFVLDRTEGTVGLMSVSFGSVLALRAASDDQLAGRFHRVTTFGGLVDLDASLRHALHGPAGAPAEGADLSRNLPVVWLQLLPHLKLAPHHESQLRAAWHRFVRHVWPEGPLAHDRGAQIVIAHELSRALPEGLRPQFLAGCGATVDGLSGALHRLHLVDAGHLDVRPHLAGLRAQVDIVHGSDDMVIPASQAEVLRGALPPHIRARVHVTGLAGHTGVSGGPREVLAEASTLAGVLWSLAALGVAA